MTPSGKAKARPAPTPTAAEIKNQQKEAPRKTAAKAASKAPATSDNKGPGAIVQKAKGKEDARQEGATKRTPSKDEMSKRQKPASIKPYC